MDYIKGRSITTTLIDTGNHTLLSLNNIIDLIGDLNPDERKQFQGELQDVIDTWIERKSIDGDEQGVNTFEG